MTEAQRERLAAVLDKVYVVSKRPTGEETLCNSIRCRLAIRFFRKKTCRARRD